MDLLCGKVMEEEDWWILNVCRKIMEEEDWWIFCVRKSWKKRTGGSSLQESHGRRELMDHLFRKDMESHPQCRKIMKEEDWWILIAGKL